MSFLFCHIHVRVVALKSISPYAHFTYLYLVPYLHPVVVCLSVHLCGTQQGRHLRYKYPVVVSLSMRPYATRQNKSECQNTLPVIGSCSSIHAGPDGVIMNVKMSSPICVPSVRDPRLDREGRRIRVEKGCKNTQSSSITVRPSVLSPDR